MTAECLMVRTGKEGGETGWEEGLSGEDNSRCAADALDFRPLKPPSVIAEVAEFVSGVETVVGDLLIAV